jgi:hypothetical protein
VEFADDISANGRLYADGVMPDIATSCPAEKLLFAVYVIDVPLPTALVIVAVEDACLIDNDGNVVLEPRIRLDQAADVPSVVNNLPALSDCNGRASTVAQAADVPLVVKYLPSLPV